MKTRTTIKDVAERAGVSKTTVSYVLSNSTNASIGEATRLKVLNAACEVGYQPNIAARALTSKRIGNVGFILSEDIMEGWLNEHYATYLSSVEDVLRKRGYGMHISRYNLTDIKNFVIPPKVGQRAVDGVLLTGYVENEVINKFNKFGIPCVCIGGNVEIGNTVPVVSIDRVKVFLTAIMHATQLGHRKIWINFNPTRQGYEAANEALRIAKETPNCDKCEIKIEVFSEGHSDYRDAVYLMNKWVQCDKTTRPTMIISSYQTSVGLLKEMRKYNLSCPEDLSIISDTNTPICELVSPGISAVEQNLRQTAAIAANILLDSLDDKITLTKDMTKIIGDCEFVMRESCKKMRD